jgi:hypothetical protein
LESFRSGLRADAVAVVFAGAYSGNPASIAGHTFLRLFSAGSEKAGGSPLLSYGFGYAAATDPRDRGLVYMWRGLTGHYTGVFTLEPFYIKTSIYNNGESRDLFEHRLSLNQDEVQFLVELIFELQAHASAPYFFLTKNCSYWLLRVLEAVRPEVTIAELERSWIRQPFVAPSETVRWLIKSGFAEPRAERRGSLRSEILARLQISSPEPDVKARLSADLWLFDRHRDLDLNRDHQALNEVSQQPVDQTARSPLSHSPIDRHLPSYLRLSAGSRGDLRLGWRVGWHPKDLVDTGYWEVAALEGPGIDISRNPSGKLGWAVNIIEVLSLAPSHPRIRRWSWSHALIFADDGFLVEGSVGPSWGRGDGLISTRLGLTGQTTGPAVSAAHVSLRPEAILLVRSLRGSGLQFEARWDLDSQDLRTRLDVRLGLRDEPGVSLVGSVLGRLRPNDISKIRESDFAVRLSSIWWY